MSDHPFAKQINQDGDTVADGILDVLHLMLDGLRGLTDAVKRMEAMLEAHSIDDDPHESPDV